MKLASDSDGEVEQRAIRTARADQAEPDWTAVDPSGGNADLRQAGKPGNAGELQITPAHRVQLLHRRIALRRGTGRARQCDHRVFANRFKKGGGYLDARLAGGGDFIVA